MSERSIGEDPFATPAHLKEPARRLRGALPAPVTIWTSGTMEEPAGLTVSSLLISEGETSRIIGLLSDTSSLWEPLEASGVFTVHLLDSDQRALADVFAGLRPAPGGAFADLEVLETRHGPAIASLHQRVACTLESITDAGYQKLVAGRIDAVELGQVSDPLLYFRGRYRRLQP